MKKILKKIPGLSVLVDSIKASITIIQYSFGIKSIQEEERADPNDPKWKNNPWAKVFVRRCKYAKQFSQKKRVLDLCCGTGWTANELSNVAKMVKAVDYSKESIEKAKKEFQNENLFFEKMNALNLKYPDSSFDTVVSMEAIEHFTENDGKVFLSEVYRVLKKGGYFVGSTPQVETKNPLKILAMKKIDPYHLHLYSKKMLEKSLSAIFNKVEVVSQPEDWMLFKCIK